MEAMILDLLLVTDRAMHAFLLYKVLTRSEDFPCVLQDSEEWPMLREGCEVRHVHCRVYLVGWLVDWMLEV